MMRLIMLASVALPALVLSAYPASAAELLAPLIATAFASALGGTTFGIATGTTIFGVGLGTAVGGVITVSTSRSLTTLERRP